MSVRGKNVQRCMVYECTNTSLKCPEKVFFSLPVNPKNRAKWYKAARLDVEVMSKSKSMYCCEDHFDLEKDTNNYIKYILTNCKLHLKKGIVPHLFIDEPKNVPGSVLTEINRKKEMIRTEMMNYERTLKKLKGDDSGECESVDLQSDCGGKENVLETSESSQKTQTHENARSQSTEPIIQSIIKRKPQYVDIQPKPPVQNARFQSTESIIQSIFKKQTQYIDIQPKPLVPVCSSFVQNCNPTQKNNGHYIIYFVPVNENSSKSDVCTSESLKTEIEITEDSVENKNHDRIKEEIEIKQEIPELYYFSNSSGSKNESLDGKVLDDPTKVVKTEIEYSENVENNFEFHEEKPVFSFEIENNLDGNFFPENVVKIEEEESRLTDAEELISVNSESEVEQENQTFDDVLPVKRRKKDETAAERMRRYRDRKKGPEVSEKCSEALSSTERSRLCRQRRKNSMENPSSASPSTATEYLVPNINVIMINYRVTDAEALISAVQTKSPIWNKSDELHNNRGVVEKCWQEISTELNKDVNVLRKSWKYLRDRFCIELKKLSQENSEESTSKWPHFKSLSFLKSGVEEKVNVDQENSSNSKIHQSSGNSSNEDDVEKLLESHEENSPETSPSSPKAKRKCSWKTDSDNIEEEELQNSKKKFKRKDSDDDDTDLIFLKSLLPQIRKIPMQWKLEFQSRIQEIIDEFTLYE